MVTLALDTSHPVGSVALARDGSVLGTERFQEPSTHLVSLGHAVDHLLASVSLTPAGIDRIAVVTGPGSFTGLRIGLSFAKGLHAARATPLVTINALHLLALPLLGRGRVCAMIDARRGEVYAAIYERDPSADAAHPAAAREVSAPHARTPETWLATLDSAPDVFVGTGVAAFRAPITAAFPGAFIAEEIYPSTAHLASIAHRLAPLEEAAVRTLEPFYVRPSGAERKRLRTHGRLPEGADG
ncbi:MAG TPA: tRNA (adenosine(37)-N6)-threonylcarbamoyltransferase complex dimerization subunit type 1 TsaB [Candidatus Krumholzibacteria bacterium]|nr:tRNA (adenosine(37)-N6)-threonylcarbamoyltransferase complex dimerization subunit type 1 TsaB [Candidatus Krumholzibacteria bacterium]